MPLPLRCAPPGRAVSVQGGRRRAATTESARWQDARRCGNPWFQLQERQHGELVSSESPVGEYLMLASFHRPDQPDDELRAICPRHTLEFRMSIFRIRDDPDGEKRN